MTRQQELVQAARKEYPEWEEAQYHFMDGAHYADQHPDIDVRTMAAWQSGYNEAVSKACEWLTRELCYTARGINLFNNKTATDEFVESFKKAMRGE